MTKIPFFKHDLGKLELEAIESVLNGSILTTGDTVAEFEKQFAEMLGVQHAVGLTSCTAALQLSLTALGIGPGDEVITTDMTFIATATAIIQAGAKPVLVDAEERTGNIDISQIEAAITDKTKAIIPVHLYGQMVDMKALRRLADQHGLKIVEDAAHCIEGSRDGIKPGQLGDTACFSFYATKNMTCGEGGAVVCNDPDIAKRLKLLRNHGMDKIAADREKNGYSHWEMPIFGWKYNMDNIQAAMLLPQMLRLQENRQKREELVLAYRKQLADIPGVQLFIQEKNVVNAHHLMPIRVPSKLRDDLITHLQQEGIGVVVNYRPVHSFQYFRENFASPDNCFPVSCLTGDSVLSLPLFPDMTSDNVEKVVTAIGDYMRRYN